MDKVQVPFKKPNKRPLARQLSLKNKKAPEVKQTLTSKYRLLKANPLLELDKDRLNELGISSEKLSVIGVPRGGASSSLPSGVMKSGPKFVEHKLIKSTSKPRVPITTSTTTTTILKKTNNNDLENSKAVIDFNVSRNILCSTKIGDRSAKKIDYVKKNIKTAFTASQKVKKIDQVAPKTENLTKPLSGGVQTSNCKAPIRRSLSAQHLERKKHANSQSKCGSFYVRQATTKSVEDLRPSTSTCLQIPHVSPVVEEILFKTPSAYERRSVALKTPNTLNRRSIYVAGRSSTPALSQDLKKRLDNWLTKRGKSLSDFHHLKCFGIHHNHNSQKPIIVYSPEEEENKENVEVDISDDDSFENLSLPRGKDDENFEKVAKEALVDLHKLIQQGYPREQCEGWLSLIRQQYQKLEEEPEYWECRAAIEQARGNITSAVECYKTAIVQGAEIKSVDESLDHLLQKFSLLNISTQTDKECSDRERARIVQDARNVFKSSIIQFAVQKRNSKSAVQQKFIVTPVRRSTRLSRTKYTSTPGVAMYSSIHDIDSPTRTKIDFQPNIALY